MDAGDFDNAPLAPALRNGSRSALMRMRSHPGQEIPVSDPLPLSSRPEGLYCPPGDFYIDPWRPVARAVITHAHSDHARIGNAPLPAARRPRACCGTGWARSTCRLLDYGERIVHHGVTLSLHPAGHVLGSAQVRLEHGGQVWVASGDYKVAPDPTCAPFEPVRCDVFITESTFGLPIYRWRPDDELFADINAWWAATWRTAAPACCPATASARRSGC
jgi:putative mRNA 3-end processing factor